MRQEFEKEYVKSFGRLSHANAKGIYAICEENGDREERLVGAWYLPSTAPLISTIENRADYVLIQFAHPGTMIRLDIGA